MSKEALGNLPTMPLEALAYQTEKQWEQIWQNLDFVKRFPKLATRLVSPEEKAKLPDDDQKSMVERSLATFMRLSWKPDEQGFVPGRALLLDENLDYPLRKGKEIAGSESTGENLMRCNIGAFILLGKSLNNKEWINNIVSESYQQLNSGKQNNFRQHILRLTTKDSFFRNYVKTNNLDGQNGFEWNRETAKLFLQLCSKSDRSLPIEFEQDLTIYPFEVVDEFAGHALKYVNGPHTIGKRASSKYASPSVFITRIKELYESGYFVDESRLSLQVQQKIEDLRSSVVKKQSNSAN